MTKHRKNSTKGAARTPMPKGMEANWFIANRKRNRRRKEIAKASARKNRKK